ncbi:MULTISPECIES: autotransporter outer membrane beta-barrel domain-containing protein [unclassified Pseudomonas]|uniref:autotransporter family protein n=1 Tax=unclassified Pseudomonas TaxID=196821 RepID=UPI0021C92B7E|nr:MULTISPECIES: autotransporter outer membrane beta-barrel domain-containing protein [unclassified Pseudomonas]MCU1735135.1 autotransporter outer membrane beta-barrel domain-containing protein [Pseudomonas sp. 20P_3.2_Bac4]MCU1744541.1 autotransporter outer membrane beta-barrel domain-containing protein [Pseudomonas sp. 20P_3.2_Bac5]
MASPIFRKTLLALAVTATTLPAWAQTVQLTNAGFLSERQTYSETLEITGTYTGGSDEDAIEFNGSHLQKDLILNATINSTGDFAGGVDMDVYEDGNTWINNQIDGSVINKGSISAIGGGANALMIDPAIIGGSVINEGLLLAKGEPLTDDGGTDVARAIDMSGSTTIKGDLVNAATGRIIAEGRDAKGINLEGGEIVGKVINRGLIQVTGAGTTAIDVTSNERWPQVDMTDLAGIENHGTIIASGDDAEGIRIDGASFTREENHLINTGTIQATDAAIVIGGFDVDLENDPTGQLGQYAPLRIINSGKLISEDEAVDASESRGRVTLELQNGSQVVGNLIDLSNVGVTGNVDFTGTSAEADGYNIRMKDTNSWFEVGDVPGNAPSQLNLLGTHTSLYGNLYMATNSTLGLNLSSATNPDVAVLSVTGIAEFDKNVKVLLAAQGEDFSANGSTYKLIEAGRIDLLDENDKIDPNAKFNLASSSALLKIDSYSVENNTLVATVTGKGKEEVEEIILGNGGSANSQKAIGSLVNDGVINRIREQNPNDPLLQALLNTDEAQLTQLAEQLSPEVNGGATQAATTSQSLVSNVTGSRTSSLRGASSGEGFKEAGVWVQSLYSDASQDLRDGVAGYNAYSRGIAVGADGKLNDQVTLGLAYSFINTDVNGKSGNKTEVDSHAFTLYGGYELGNYFVDASLTYGVNDNDSKRSIAGTQAKASYDSDLLGLNLVGGYTWKINPQLLVEPRLAARYSQVNIDGYREKGSSAALKVEDQRYEAIELGAGVRVAGSYALGAGTLEPQVKLMAYHDFAADQSSSTSTFLLGNTPFVTTGAKAVRNSYEAGIGTDYKLGAVTLGVNYDYVGKSGFDADVFSAKVRYDF